MKRFTVVVLILLATPAFAQQQPDSAFMQRALGAIQVQRNQALDAVVVCEARATGLADDLAKAKARIKEIEAKQEEKK